MQLLWGLKNFRVTRGEASAQFDASEMFQLSTTWEICQGLFTAATSTSSSTTTYNCGP